MTKVASRLFWHEGGRDRRAAPALGWRHRFFNHAGCLIAGS